jgi:hypothetical protein
MRNDLWKIPSPHLALFRMQHAESLTNVISYLDVSACCCSASHRFDFLALFAVAVPDTSGRQFDIPPRFVPTLPKLASAECEHTPR